MNTIKHCVSGLYADSTGTYHQVNFISNETGIWRLLNHKCISPNTRALSTLFIDNSPALALPAQWIASDDVALFPDYIKGTCAHSHQPIIADYIFSTCVLPMQNVVSAVVPEQAFLTILPVALCTDVPASFVTIALFDKECVAGITINHTLTAVFSVYTSEIFAGSRWIEQLRVWFALKYPDTEFPATVYTIGNVKLDSDYFSKLVPLADEFSNDTNLVKAAGAALYTVVVDNVNIPKFEVPLLTNSMRSCRSRIIKTSACLVALFLIALVFTGSINIFEAHKNAHLQKLYIQTVKSNKALQQIVEQNQELAQSILRIEETSIQKSNWGQFLQKIGEIRPTDLYFEAITSQNIDSNTTKISIKGWTARQELVTGFIAALERLPILSDISLSSIERDPAQKTVCRFQVLCILSLKK